MLIGPVTSVLMMLSVKIYAPVIWDAFDVRISSLKGLIAEQSWKTSHILSCVPYLAPCAVFLKLSNYVTKDESRLFLFCTCCKDFNLVGHAAIWHIWKKLLLSADLMFVKIDSHINVIFATIYFITASKTCWKTQKNLLHTVEIWRGVRQWMLVNV